ncbi:Chromatin modification-related protein eaf3 [Golovinomyces cichoracearum]|uniref:Chromatin modification-related protein eaf3 n=1 Tax=Golovinomyces cichoracearum TaxID=62708 RepID=A0A420ILM7_9PEZI|nr:Chromatin modification-related protein eaf3 [Golovinomyces cichoracearum]
MSVYYASTMRCSTRRRSSTLNALKTISPGSTKSIIKDGRKRWDDWILQDRVRKFTEANKELATQLQYQVKASKSGQQKMSASKSGKRVTGGRGAVPSSGLSSTRGSEERNASVPLSQSARAPRRNRDYDVETVSGVDFFTLSFSWPNVRLLAGVSWNGPDLGGG